MSSRDVMQRRQPCIHIRKRLVGRVEAVEIASQFVARFLQEHLHGVHELARAGEVFVRVLRILNGAQDVRGTAAEIVLNLRRRSADCRDDLLCPGESSMRRGNLVEAAEVLPKRAKFLGLVGKQCAALLPALRIGARRLEFRRSFRSAPVGVRHRGSKCRIRTEVVEQAPLLVWAA